MTFHTIRLAAYAAVGAAALAVLTPSVAVATADASTMTSSFVPTGSTFIFRGKIDIGATAKGEATYTVP